MKKTQKFLVRSSSAVSQRKKKCDEAKKQKKNEKEGWKWEYVVYHVRHKVLDGSEKSILGVGHHTVKFSKERGEKKAKIYSKPHLIPMSSKLKKKKGSTTFEPCNPLIKQSSWGGREKKILWFPHVALPLFIQDDVLHLFALLVAFQDFLNWRDRVFCTTVWHRVGFIMHTISHRLSSTPSVLISSLFLDVL